MLQKITVFILAFVVAFILAAAGAYYYYILPLKVRAAKRKTPVISGTAKEIRPVFKMNGGGILDVAYALDFSGDTFIVAKEFPAPVIGTSRRGIYKFDKKNNTESFLLAFDKSFRGWLSSVSPDGKKAAIFFMEPITAPSRLMIFEVDNPEKRIVVNGSDYAGGHSSWDLDGNFYFAKGNAGNDEYSLHVLRAGKQTPEQIHFDSSEEAFFPQITEDGKCLYYISRPVKKSVGGLLSRPYSVKRINLITGSRDTLCSGWEAVPLPGGKLLVFSDSYQTAILDLETMEEKILTSQSGKHMSVRGKNIYYISRDENNDKQLYSVGFYEFDK